MSEEELSDRMILIINGYKECLDYNCNQTEERQREIKYDIETLETMIDLYNKEKEKNKNSISKNKIKEIIKKVDDCSTDMAETAVFWLEELLEE